jgi:hypothetical protein
MLWFAANSMGLTQKDGSELSRPKLMAPAVSAATSSSVLSSIVAAAPAEVKPGAIKMYSPVRAQ